MSTKPTPDDLEALARKHGATSYRNRADTQHPAYGFTEDGLRNLLAEVRKADTELIRQMLEALEYKGTSPWKKRRPAITAARARLGGPK